MSEQNTNIDIIAKLLIQRGIYLKGIVKDKKINLGSKNRKTLKIRKHKGKTEYYISETGDNKERYIGRVASELVIKIAQESYDRKATYAARRELEVLNKIFNTYFESDKEGKTYRPKFKVIETIYEDMSEERRNLVKPVLVTDAQYIAEWENKEYKGKAFDEETTEYYTEKGERVRSKSEVLIANMLNRKGIPYKYECPIVLKQQRTIYPDFTILDVKRRKEWYWEHMGMLEDKEYCIKNMEKIIAYEKTGILPGRELIITHETSVNPLNIRVIEAVLEKYLH